jgi:hypothetical protein
VYADQPEGSDATVMVVRDATELSDMGEGRQPLIEDARAGERLPVVEGTAKTNSSRRHRFRSLSAPQSLSIRLIYHLLQLFLLFVSYVSIFPSPWAGSPNLFSTLGGFIQGLFYVFLLGVTITVYLLAYLRRLDVGSTVVPFAGTRWYKVYTVVLIAFAVVILMLSAIETRSACGKWTTYQPVIRLNNGTVESVDRLLCRGTAFFSDEDL